MSDGHALVVWVFLRLLGVVHVVAFASLRSQILGLIGSDGLLPAAELDAGLPRGAFRWTRAPSLYWLRPTDAGLVGMCDAGIVLGLCLAVGLLQGPAVLGLWALYLSLCTVGRRFLAYQWDALLVEVTLAAALVAPWRALPAAVEPSPLALWVLRILLFRLLFFSGWVKLASGDRSWRDLTALAHHYETQPLPNPLSRAFHRLPLGLQKASTAFNHLVELVVPWLIFLPQPCPAIAAGAFVLLMVLLQVSGNFGFFQLLTVVLCVPLLRDDLLLASVPWLAEVRVASPVPASDALVIPLALAWFGVAAIQSLGQLAPAWVPLPAARLLDALGPWRSLNAYGLFAVMTTERPEVVLEVSDDGETWLPCELPYKPGDPDRRPRVAFFHLPRLDWQLWFAALGSCRTDRWVLSLEAHLLKGTPEVRALFADVPLPHPRHVRSTLWQYRFAGSPMPADQVGAWWQRTYVGPYCPALSLDLPDTAPARTD